MSFRNQKFFSYQERICCEYKFHVNQEPLRNLSPEEIVKNLATRVHKFLTTTTPRLFLWHESPEFYENQCIKGLDPNDWRSGILCNCRYLYSVIEKKAPFVRIDNDLVCEYLDEDANMLRSYTEMVRLKVINCLNNYNQSFLEERIDILVISSSEKKALDEVSAREEKAFEQREAEEARKWERELECRCTIL